MPLCSTLWSPLPLPTTEASDFIEKEENNAKLQDETGALRAKIEALDNKLQEVLEEK